MQKNGRIILVSIVVLLAFVGIASADQVLYNGTTSGHGIPAILDRGNPDCGTAGCFGDHQFKIEQTNGDYTGKYYVDATHWIDITEIPDNIISWNSNFDVGCIIMKGASGADVYYCTNTNKRDDTFMSTPINPSGGFAGISHIIICYSPPDINVPEFPVWFVSLMGIAGLTGLLVMHQRK